MQSLVRQVGVAFARADLPPEALHTPIVHRDLPWQCPPLVTGAVFEKTLLQDHFDYPIAASSAADLHQWWESTLYMMHMSPSRCMRHGVYVGMAKAFPSMRNGSKAFRFSVPENCPEPLERMAGITFSLEAAHAAWLSLPTRRLVADADNYYVVTMDGLVIGVADGVPAIGPSWDISAAGFVDEVLRSPRGAVTFDCDFDSIAKARSLLHEYPSRFPEYEVLDLVLQSLRYMTWGSQAPQLFQAARAEKLEKLGAREKLRKLNDSLSCLDLPISDRAKLQQMHGTLVPDVISVTAFRNIYHHGPPFPYTAMEGKMEHIRADLASRVEELQRRV